MICSTQYQLQLNKSYSKVLLLYPAFGQSFVFLAHRSGIDVLVHCSTYGKIMYEHTFNFLVNSFAMINEAEAIVLLTREDSILVINFETQQTRKIPFYFIFSGSDQSEIFIFQQTKFICVKERGNFNEPNLKLSYFKYPIQNQKPFIVYQSKDDQWTHQYLIKQGNANSLVLWFKPRQDDEIDIRCFSIEEQKNKYAPKFKIHSIQNTVGEAHDLSRIQLAINSAWEITKGNILLVTISSRSETLVTTGLVDSIKNILIFQTGKQTIRDAKFIFPKQYNDCIIDYMRIGYNSMFRTYSFQNGRTRQSPVYYINNQTEQIVGEQTWECSYQYKFFINGINENQLVECQYDNSDVHHIKVALKKVLDFKAIALHFLLEINPDFDDDLLKGAIDFLTPDD